MNYRLEDFSYREDPVLEKESALSSRLIAGIMYLILFTFFLSLLLLAFLARTMLLDDSIPKNVFFMGIDLGGMAPASAKEKIEKLCEAVMERPIFLEGAEEKFVLIPRKAMDMNIDVDSIVRNVLAIGRRGNILSRIKTRMRLAGGRERRYVPVYFYYDMKQLRRTLAAISDFINSQARPADFVSGEGGTYRIRREERGVELDIERTADEIIAEIEEPSSLSFGRVAVQLKFKEPDVKLENKLAELNSSDLKASFEVNYPVDGKWREAVEEAVRRLDGIVLKPGAILSFSKIASPPLGADRCVLGDDDGYCLVASALYNAALLADLAIVERFNHPRAPRGDSYKGAIGLGRDAMVTMEQDLKIRNPGKSPIIILAEYSGDTVSIRLLGQGVPETRFALVEKKRKIIRAPVRSFKDNSLEAGRIIREEGHDGYEVSIERIEYFRNGQEKDRKIISNDVYGAKACIIRTGARVE